MTDREGLLKVSIIRIGLSKYAQTIWTPSFAQHDWSMAHAHR